MVSQPALLALGQLQLLVGQQEITAGAPALRDAVTFVDGHGRQHRIDNTQENALVPVYRKAEAVRLVFAEVGHAHVLQVALVDHVMSGNGVAQEHIRLIKSHCIQGVLIGGIRTNVRLRVQLFHFAQRQVVIDKAQAKPGQPIAQTACFPVTGHQYGLIHCIGFRQGQVRVRGLKAVGGAQQVDFTRLKGADRCLSSGIAQNLDWQGQGLSQQPRIISSQALIVVAAGGQIEGGIVRCRGAQYQLAFVLQPLALSPVQLSIELNNTRAAQ